MTKPGILIGIAIRNRRGKGYKAACPWAIHWTLSSTKRCRLFLGNDTSTMHMAAAVGLPCVAIYSSRERPDIWYPKGIGHKIFRTTIDCEGFGLIECLERGNECINKVSTDEMLSACREILGIGPGARPNYSSAPELASSR
jgi:ADP-heptose:LPS heptosyltransferase